MVLEIHPFRGATLSREHMDPFNACGSRETSWFIGANSGWLEGVFNHVNLISPGFCVNSGSVGGKESL